jgi:hypothetical protein
LTIKKVTDGDPTFLEDPKVNKKLHIQVTDPEKEVHDLDDID